MGLRIGVNLCEPHQCPCGKLADARGTHGLSCKRGAARGIRHNQHNDIVRRALVRVNIPSVLEPTGLSRGDGKRPYGMTLTPWKVEKNITWEVTVTDTVVDSYLHSRRRVQAARRKGRPAERKLSKQVSTTRTPLIPLAFETYGPINNTGIKFLQELGRRLRTISDDPRESAFLRQRISITLQRFKAIAFSDTFTPDRV